jgi:hypothetical protein
MEKEKIEKARKIKWTFYERRKTMNMVKAT